MVPENLVSSHDTFKHITAKGFCYGLSNVVTLNCPNAGDNIQFRSVNRGNWNYFCFYRWTKLLSFHYSNKFAFIYFQVMWVINFLISWEKWCLIMRSHRKFQIVNVLPRMWCKRWNSQLVVSVLESRDVPYSTVIRILTSTWRNHMHVQMLFETTRMQQRIYPACVSAYATFASMVRASIFFLRLFVLLGFFLELSVLTIFNLWVNHPICHHHELSKWIRLSKLTELSLYLAKFCSDLNAHVSLLSTE